MTDKKSTIWQEELRKHLDNATPTEDWRKSVEQDDRIIQFDNGELLDNNPFVYQRYPKALSKEEVAKHEKELIAEHEKLHAKAKAEFERYNVAEDMHVNAKILQSIGLPDLDEESKRSDRFFGMRLNKSTDDIENTFLVMFAEFVSLMAILIGVLGFGILLWAIFS